MHTTSPQPLPHAVAEHRRRLVAEYNAACRERLRQIDAARVMWRLAIQEAKGSRAQRAKHVRLYRMLYDKARELPVPAAPYLSVDWNHGLERA